MSRVYGPYPLKLGISGAPDVMSFQFTPDVRYIRLINDSFYDLVIKVGGSSPITPPVEASGPAAFPIQTLNGDYGDVVPAGSRLTVDVANGSLTGSQAYSGQLYWDGNLYVGVTDGSGLLELSGNISTRKLLWIVTYANGETPPDEAPSPRTVDLSSQSRLIALPPTPQGLENGIFTPTAAGATQVLGTFASSPSIATFLLYALAISSSVTGSMSFRVNIEVVNPAVTTLVNQGTICRLDVTSPFSFALPLAAPLYVLCSALVPGELDTVRLVLTLVSGTAFAVNTFMAYDLSMAPNNLNPIASPGMATANTGLAANGTIW